ncbi:DnaJ protein [Pantoea phage Phynn]|nr:DnaJ protein [Pantoea phage Phynn]
MINENMTTSQAYKILGGTGSETSAELSRLFKRASLRAHPDRPGGSAELMKQINQAYDVITKTGSTTGGRTETYADQRARYAAQKQEYQERLDVYMGLAKNYFTNKFNAQEFADHFTKFTGQPTTFKVNFAKSSISVQVEFQFTSGDAKFDIDFICQPAAAKGLAAPDASALGNVTVHTFVLVGTKKHKMSSRDWVWGKNPDHVTPDSIFPSSKLKSIFTPSGKKMIFKRADYMASFVKLLNASVSGNDIRIDVGGLKVWIYRTVMMRKGCYNLGAIYDERVNKFRPVETISGSLLEDEEGACLDMIVDTFKELQKLKPDAAGVKNALLKMVAEFRAGHRSTSFVKRAAAQAAAPKPEEKPKRTVNRIGKEDYFSALREVGASGSGDYWHFDNGAGITLHFKRFISNRKGKWSFSSYEFKHNGVRQNEWVRFVDIEETTDGSTIQMMKDTMIALRGVGDWYQFGQILKQMEANYKAGKYVAPHVKKTVEAKKTPAQQKDELGAQPTAPTAAKKPEVDSATQAENAREVATMNATIRSMLSALVKAGRGKDPEQVKTDVEKAISLWTSKHK